MSRTYLLVIGEAAALTWVIAEEHAAFPASAAQQAAALEIHDELLVYTTRGCFHDPDHDAGRVMAMASVKSRVHELAEPVVFGSHSLTLGCELTVFGLAPFRQGIELRRLVGGLHAFPKKRSWGIRLRPPLVPLDEHDADLLKRRLRPFLRPRERHLGAYLSASQ